MSGLVDELSPDVAEKRPTFNDGDRVIVFPSDSDLGKNGSVKILFSLCNISLIFIMCRTLYLSKLLH